MELRRDRIGILLQGREDYLRRPDPTLWRSGDVHRLLIDHLPARQTDAWGLAEHAVDTVREFLRFLDGSGRLHPGSTRIVTLLKELDRVGGKFGAAMADTSRYRLAKRVWTAMREDGLSFDSDVAEIDRWAERFSALDAQGRRRVLGELMDQDPRYASGCLVVHGSQVAMLMPGVPPDKSLVWPDLVPCDCGCADVALAPPPVLPADTELVAAVAGSELLRRLSVLAEWMGDGGRPVDRHGELSRKDVPAAAAAVGVPDQRARPLRDVPALAMLWDLALELGVLSLCHARVIPGDTLPTLRAVLRRDAALEQALDLWDEVFDEVVDPDADAATPEQEQLREWMQPWTPHMLGNLYREFPDSEFADVGKLMDGVIAERAGNRPAGDELLDALARSVLLRGMSVLAELGAVEVDGLRVRLTGLGQRIVYKRLASEHGVEVPPVVSATLA